MKLLWRPLAQQQKNGITTASNSTLTSTIQFWFIFMHICMSTRRSRWYLFQPLKLNACTFVPLPCSMVAMFLVTTALTMSQSFAPIIGIRYAMSVRWVLTINRSIIRSCISGECREYWEADSDLLSSEVCGLFKSGHAAVTDSILLTFLTRSTSPIYPLNDL